MCSELHRIRRCRASQKCAGLSQTVVGVGSKKWYNATKSREIEMDNHCLDVTNPHHAYMYGLIQTDGHMSKETRNRGKVRIELGEQDRAVLELSLIHI